MCSTICQGVVYFWQMKKATLLALVLSMFYIGCESPIMYQKQIDVKDPWAYEDALVYDFEVDDIGESYEMLLAIEYNDDFAYQNLYLKIQTRYPDEKVVDDILSINLSNKMGGWIGRCSGNTCTIDILLQNEFKFQANGSYQISVSQHSRDKNLIGIVGAEMTVKKIAK